MYYPLSRPSLPGLGGCLARNVLRHVHRLHQHERKRIPVVHAKRANMMMLNQRKICASYRCERHLARPWLCYVPRELAQGECHVRNNVQR